MFATAFNTEKESQSIKSGRVLFYFQVFPSFSLVRWKTCSRAYTQKFIFALVCLQNKRYFLASIDSRNLVR